MISILITAYREPATIGKAIEAFLGQLPTEAELLVVTPDPETTAVVQGYAARYPVVQHVLDPQRGKPTALNFGLQAARGEIIIFSDGDVTVEAGAVAALLRPFEDAQIGAVSGRPISANARDPVLGYWSHLLTDSAHAVRLARATTGGFLVCSGYLFAVRRATLVPVPADALSEDAVISHRIAEQGYRIGYAPEALVRVKYPSTYGDWLRQKVRSAGGYAQDYVRRSPVQMRSAWLEIRHGTALALKYPRSAREFWWTLLLFLARLHLWLLVLLNVRIKKMQFTELWQRVESTK